MWTRSHRATNRVICVTLRVFSGNEEPQGWFPEEGVEGWEPEMYRD